MPIFEYVCCECNHRFELLIQGSAEAVCPKCQTSKVDKQFSAFGVGAAHLSVQAPRDGQEGGGQSAGIRGYYGGAVAGC